MDRLTKLQRFVRLTDIQAEVIYWRYRGYTISKIAEELEREVPTIQTRLTGVFKTLLPELENPKESGWDSIRNLYGDLIERWITSEALKEWNLVIFELEKKIKELEYKEALSGLTQMLGEEKVAAMLEHLDSLSEDEVWELVDKIKEARRQSKEEQKAGLKAQFDLFFEQERQREERKRKEQGG